MNLTKHNGPSIPFPRPLRSFPGEARLELNSPVTIDLVQLMRVLGFPMDAVMSKQLGASGWKNVQNALLRKHRPSKTTRALILKAFGPLGAAFLEVAETGGSETLEELSAWEAFLLPLTGPHDAFVAGVARANVFLAQLERLAKRGHSLASGGTPIDDRVQLEEFVIRARGAWKDVLIPSSPEAAFALDSTLHALAEFDAGVGEFLGKRAESRVSELLAPRKQPLGHWMRRVQRAYQVANNRTLADLLLRHGVRIKAEKVATPITQDTLRKWACAGQLAKASAVQALLSALPLQQKRHSADRLDFDYRLARGLTFLVQAIVALGATKIDERQAQSLVRERYLALFRQTAGSC